MSTLTRLIEAEDRISPVECAIGLLVLALLTLALFFG
jgi:hypothetical protein